MWIQSTGRASKYGPEKTLAHGLVGSLPYSRGSVSYCQRLSAIPSRTRYQEVAGLRQDPANSVVTNWPRLTSYRLRGRTAPSGMLKNGSAELLSPGRGPVSYCQRVSAILSRARQVVASVFQQPAKSCFRPHGRTRAERDTATDTRDGPSRRLPLPPDEVSRRPPRGWPRRTPPERCHTRRSPPAPAAPLRTPSPPALQAPPRACRKCRRASAARTRSSRRRPKRAPIREQFPFPRRYPGNPFDCRKR